MNATLAQTDDRGSRVDLPARTKVAARTGLALLAAVLAVTSCSSGSTHSRSTGASNGDGSTGASAAGASGSTGDITVTGAFGAKPTLNAPSGAAPTKLGVKVLTTGKGVKVAKGQILIARQYAQTWPSAKAKPVVVGDSYVVVPLGTGRAIPAWDQALTGQRVGSRVLLALPATKGAAATAPVSSRAMVMVFDLLAVVAADATAKGTPLDITGVKGLPTIKSASGAAPTITSAGEAGKVTKPASALLLRGTGAAIDPAKLLVVKVLQADATATKSIKATGGQPYVVSAAGILGTATALKGAPTGSRAVAVTPSSKTAHGQILVIDVIAQV